MSHTPHKIDAVDATSIGASIGANCSMLEAEHRDSEEGIEVNMTLVTHQTLVLLFWKLRWL